MNNLIHILYNNYCENHSEVEKEKINELIKKLENELGHETFIRAEDIINQYANECERVAYLHGFEDAKEIIIGK